MLEIDSLRERALSAIIQTVTTKRTAPQVPAAHRKRNRDRRVAALSLDLVPAENQRAIRALNQALLAGELHDAMALCLQSNLLMPLAALLRSLIDTSVLGIWLLKYATDEEVRDSVAHVSAVDKVQRSFASEDRSIFSFIFQPVKGTDHEFYRDVLHPSAICVLNSVANCPKSALLSNCGRCFSRKANSSFNIGSLIIRSSPQAICLSALRCS